MKNVYLSYSGRNCEAVLQVMERIIAEGYGLLCDCMVPQQGSFAQRAEKNIRDADLVVAVITEDVEDCPYMDTELDIALRTGAKLVPIAVGDAELPARYRGVPEAVEICKVSEYPTAAEMAAVAEKIRIKNEQP